ncbi:MAG: hypothetical protein R3D62_00695 [Xanthobacteraceae bacterium]
MIGSTSTAWRDHGARREQNAESRGPEREHSRKTASPTTTGGSPKGVERDDNEGATRESDKRHVSAQRQADERGKPCRSKAHHQ